MNNELNKQLQIAKKYRITEKWYVSGRLDNKETREVSNLKEVKSYIVDFIDSWKEHAEEAEKKVISIKTDYKTFAKVKILFDTIQVGIGSKCKLVDTFSVNVKKLCKI